MYFSAQQNNFTIFSWNKSTNLYNSQERGTVSVKIDLRPISISRLLWLIAALFHGLDFYLRHNFRENVSRSAADKLFFYLVSRYSQAELKNNSPSRDFSVLAKAISFFFLACVFDLFS